MIKYFKVQNTGWSNGVSWYNAHPESTRFESFEEAKKYYHAKTWDDSSVKWRIVEVTIVRHFEDESNIAQVTRSVTQERYLYIYE
jgi:predicted RNA-binding protein with PUA-like domain